MTSSSKRASVWRMISSLEPNKLAVSVVKKWCSPWSNASVLIVWIFLYRIYWNVKNAPKRWQFSVKVCVCWSCLAHPRISKIVCGTFDIIASYAVSHLHFNTCDCHCSSSFIKFLGHQILPKYKFPSQELILKYLEKRQSPKKNCL